MNKDDYVATFERAILTLEHVHRAIQNGDASAQKTLLRTLARLQALCNHVDYHDQPFKEE